jgi:hypothetical protein
MVGILKAVKSDTSVENNTKAFNVLLSFCGGVLCSFLGQLLYTLLHLICPPVLCAIPWFIVEKRRPGLVLPPGSSLATIGFKQTLFSLRECFRLKQTFLYLVYYFLM